MRRMKNETVERTIKALRMLKQHNKTLEETARELGVDKGNLSRDIRQMKDEVNFWSSIIDGPVRTERLLEADITRILREKFKQLKIRRAEEGRLPGGTPPFGCVLKNGLLFEKPGEIETLREIFRLYLDGKTRAEIARRFGMSPSKVYTILRDERYIARFTYIGKIYKGGWKPFINPEIFEEVQRKRPKDSTLLLWGYEWYDQKIRINDEKKEVIDSVVEKFLEEKNIRKIAISMGLPWWIVSSIVRDERRTGKIMKNGKLIPSGYPETVPRETWEKMQRIKPSGASFMKQKAVENQLKIRKCIPAFRWQIYEKTRLCRPTVRKNINQMKRNGELKERADGLLQFSWLPYPEDVSILSRTVKGRQKAEKIRHLLSERWLTMSELAEKTGISYFSIRNYTQKLRPELERRRTKKGFKLHLKS